jgi:hypothetical protein
LGLKPYTLFSSTVTPAFPETSQFNMFTQLAVVAAVFSAYLTQVGAQGGQVWCVILVH